MSPRGRSVSPCAECEHEFGRQCSSGECRLVEISDMAGTCPTEIGQIAMENHHFSWENPL